MPVLLQLTMNGSSELIIGVFRTLSNIEHGAFLAKIVQNSFQPLTIFRKKHHLRHLTGGERVKYASVDLELNLNINQTVGLKIPASFICGFPLAHHYLLPTISPYLEAFSKTYIYIQRFRLNLFQNPNSRDEDNSRSYSDRTEMMRGKLM